MKKLALLLFLVGCGSGESETGTVDFALTLDSSPSCSGRMNLIFSRPSKTADLDIVGSWTCGSTYSGPVTGVWPAGAERMSLTLTTFPATASFGWLGLDGTVAIAGSDVPFHSHP